MAIIKQYHKDTDTTYVYESESYWDPELKQARSKRKCIGKVDPETGEIIPTGKRGRQKKGSVPEDYSSLISECEALRKEKLELSSRIRELEKQLDSANKKLSKHQATADRIEELTKELRDH